MCQQGRAAVDLIKHKMVCAQIQIIFSRGFLVIQCTCSESLNKRDSVLNLLGYFFLAAT